MYQRILVPLDGSPSSEVGLAEALRIAHACHAQIRLLHVIDDLSLGFGMAGYGEYPGDWLSVLQDAGTEILESGKALAVAAGVPVDTVLEDKFLSSLADVVLQQTAAWKADLIVIGTHGRRGVSRLMLGSDAERILRSSNVPVLTVHHTTAASSTPKSKEPTQTSISANTNTLLTAI